MFIKVSRLYFYAVLLFPAMATGARENEVVTLDPLMVTAQKFSEPVQDVPIAMTTYGTRDLERLLVNELEDFAAFAPNVEIQEQSPNNPGFVIRGITSDSGAAFIEPRVSVFQDGVSISKSRGSYLELFDVERIEVLRGPQGTLFGRGAQIGAIHILQNKARFINSTHLEAGTGNKSRRVVEGHVNVPVMEDSFAVRFAGTWASRDGYVDNLGAEALNGKESRAGRISLRWDPSERTRLDAIFNYQEDDYPGTSFKSGIFAPPGGDTGAASFAGLNRGNDLFIKRDVWGLTLLASHDLNNNLALNSITGYREFDSHEEFDADGTLAYFLEFGEIAYGDQFSQEFRLNYDAGGPFKGFAGISFFSESGFQKVPLRTDERSVLTFVGLGEPLIGPDGLPLIVSEVNPATGTPLNTNYTESFTNFGDNTAYEAFLDGTWRLGDQLELTAGIRITREEIESAYEQENNRFPFFNGNPGFLLPATNGRQEGSGEFTSAVGRLVATYHYSEDSNVFASVSRGRRPNVINVDNDGAEVLDDEIVLSYEIGYKGLLLGGRLSLEVNVFHYDYSNFQTNVLELGDDGNIIAETQDNGSATAWGAEAQVRMQVNEFVYVFASAGWLDATFDDTDSEGNGQELAGNRFRLSPESTFALGMTLELPLRGQGTLYLSPNYTWKSQFFFEEENQQGIEQGDFGLLNASLGYRWQGGKYELSAFGTNLLDKEYLVDAGNTGESFGIPTFIAGPPALYGLEFRIRF